MIKHDSKKNIVIVGGGFGGLRAALKLDKKIPRDYKIVLIDTQNYHLFTPEIYEIASTPKEDAIAEKLKGVVTVPYETILRSASHVAFLQDTVLDIDPAKKEVVLKDSGSLSFEYAILAVGSETNFYGIEGLEEAACVLKDVSSAIRLRNVVRDSFDKAASGDQPLRIVVGGGGIGGIELAGELVGYLERLKKLLGSRVGWEMSIVQGAKTILPNFSPAVIKKARGRLARLSIKIFENERIEKVANHEVKANTGKTFPFDVLLWAGGIKPSKLTESLKFKKDEGGRILVDEFFCPIEKNGGLCPEVFVIGDSSSFRFNGGPLPATSWSAISQGEHIAKVIIAKIKNGKPPAYRPLSRRYIVPLKGKYAIAELFGTVLSGPHVWLLKSFVYLRYLLQILPFWRAIPRWTRAFLLFLKND